MARVRKRTVVAVGVVVVASAAAIAVLQLRHSDTATLSFDGPVDRVRLDVDAGQVSIVGRAEPGVRISRSRHSFLGAVPLTTERVAGGMLRVIGVCPGGLVLGCRTDFRIEVPAGVFVEASTASADVAIEGVTGTVEVKSKGGRVRLRGLGSGVVLATTTTGSIVGTELGSSQLNVKTRRGNIALSLTRPADDVDLETTKGSVDLSLPDAPYRVRTDSAIGIVKVGVTQDAGSRRTITVTAPEGDIRVVPTA